MANHVLLNNLDHQDLKIITDKSEEYGNNTMYSVVYPFEFSKLQADYPIFFHKDNNSNTYTALALLGFEERENLFLRDEQWHASYIPLMIEREPFLIGQQSVVENGETVENTVIHLDLDNPRVNKNQGTDIFLPHGGNSEYINKISSTLKAIHESKPSTKHFMDTMIALDLFESFNLDIQLTNGSNNRLSGFYTINEDKLMNLKGETLEELNKSGLLKLIYMVIASHENINALIQLKDKLVSV
ncbi:multidrug transporter [Colwellia sp. 75C3]|uniref:SapC family protein n=1 Tax=Colwellia sp. 75C3 TaxID=888425 RepID=UPI000C31E130|nr:SapC family protein [Colwellia sp. 75C3]PKG85892.1 multidrug transporter [Colwellia sp. 75C3]